MQYGYIQQWMNTDNIRINTLLKYSFDLQCTCIYSVLFLSLLYTCGDDILDALLIIIVTCQYQVVTHPPNPTRLVLALGLFSNLVLLFCTLTSCQYKNDNTYTCKVVRS